MIAALTVGSLVLQMLVAGTGPQNAPAHPAPKPPEAPQVTAANYRVYTPDGHAASLDDVVAAMANADVVFVGEEHDDPVAHFLESDLLRRANEKYGKAAGPAARPVTLSLEMFERDVQTIVDEYLSDLITEKHFLSSSRPWARYATDYRPMVEYAHEQKLPVVAANTPGRYANRAARLGRDSLDALPSSARQWLPPLPYGAPDPAYAQKFEALMGGAGPSSPHAPLHLIDAQVLWDAGMAFSIAQALMRTPSGLVLQVNGGFHSEDHMGIPTQLARYRPGTRQLTVQVYSGRGFPNFDISKLGHLGDFIILTDPALKPPDKPE